MKATDLMIKKLFTRMDDWRHLPSYQLERRADLFFSLYIPEVISKIFKCEVKDELIPEFPVKLSIIYNNRSENDNSFNAENYNLKSNQSVKIDYVAITKNYKKAFLIELKTDKHSVNQEQVDNLIYSGEDFSVLIGGIQEIYCNSASKSSIYRNKYHCLLDKLDNMGLFEEKGAFKKALVHKRNYDDLGNEVKSLKLNSNINEMEKVYIVPSKTNSPFLKDKKIQVITFKDFIKRAKESNSEDKISSIFFDYLEIWDNADAGDK